MENSRKPKIRFKGYNDDWEQRKLDSLCKLITKQTGFDYSETIKPALVTDKELNTYSFIQNKDFEGENINLDTDFYIPIEVAERFPKIILDMPSLLISISGKIGNVGYYGLKTKAFIGGAVGICKLKEDIGSMLVYALQSEAGQTYFRSLIKASSHANITVEDIRNIIIKLPHNERESQKVAEYFCDLDHLITLHQRKLDKLINVKKSMLEKMFPKQGSTVPEIRFSGFTDDWEQRKLSDIYQNIGNAFVGTATPYYVEQGHFYLESNNIKNGQINHNSEVFINNDFYERQKDKWLHTGDMVMVQSGHVGHAAVIPEKLDNSAAHALIMFRNAKVEIEPYLLNYQYQTSDSKKKIDNITTGNTIKHILASDMKQFTVDIPSIGEQQLVANYFIQLDELITLHQRKLEKLRNIKKSMLEKMFI